MDSVVSDAGDIDTGRPLLGPGADIAVGALVRPRYGDAVVDQLVDPLLGGVYAGRADDLSLAVTMPGLAAAARAEHTLAGAVRATLARRAPATGPAFATVEGGLSRLVAAAAHALSPVPIKLGQPVRRLERGPDGYRLVRGPAAWPAQPDRVAPDGVTPGRLVPDRIEPDRIEPEILLADAVLLAVPAPPAARLLSGVSPDAADTVGALEYASVALVTILLPPGALDGTGLADRSGALVPATSGHLVKAVTVFSTKWAAQPDGAVLLRVSVGRYRDAGPLRLHDASLTAAAVEDLSKIVGGPLPAPLHTAVTRWGGALPQYPPGHLDRVAAARAALPPTLALAGAAYDGVGIPACIRSAEAAADRLIGALT
jgi:oxygen-dependent protoporphyrinogen oxidase